MLLKEATFIKDEGGAPLLMQNHFYLHKHSQIAWEKTRVWKKLLLGQDDIKTDQPAKPTKKALNNNSKHLEQYGVRIVAKPNRLIIKDAQRNFETAARQQLLITILEALKSLFNDYQQTMASISGILLLFFDAKSVFEMMFMLGRNPKYGMCGYWRHDAIKQGIDTYVIYNILQQINPKLYKHLEHFNVLSGWIQPHFGGLAVQTMPIEHLIDFWTALFEKGFRYLFKYILSLLLTLSPLLLCVNRTDKLMAMLRCNRKSRFWECLDIEERKSNMLKKNDNVSMFFEKVLNDIKLVDSYCNLEELDFQKEREVAFNSYLCGSLLNAAVGVTFATFEIESGNDSDEPKDCVQCDDGCADIFCTECEIYLCDGCHNQSLDDHIVTHSIQQLYD